MRTVNLLKRIDLDVNVIDIFQYPTIQSLATHLAGQVKRNHDVLPVRRTGADRPLFLVHEFLGQVIYAGNLEPHIHQEIPLYAFPGKPIDETQLYTMEAIAARLVSIIRRIQATGPYSIAGWSFGGVIAYEVARQLIGADQVVDFLGLLDTYCFSRQQITAREQGLGEDKAKGILLEICKTREGFNPGLSFDSEMDLGATLQKCRELSLLPDYITDLTEDEIRKSADRAVAHLRAWAQYSPQPIPVPVHLFVAQDRSDRPELEPSSNFFRGWDRILPKDRINVIPTPGTHQTMVVSPHVECLGRSLSDSICKAREMEIRVPEDDYSPPVLIQAGNKGQRPVFCVPGAGANVLSFTQLAEALGKEWTVHGLQPRGFDSGLIPHTTVPAAAECYLRAINQLQPTGSIHLVGHSFGGWVVLEMAQRLRMIGRPVASLTIVDSQVPGSDIDKEYSRSDVLKQLIKVFEQDAECCLEIDWADLESREDQTQIEVLHRELVRVGMMPQRSSAEALEGPLVTFAACLHARYQPETTYPDLLNLVLVDQGNSDVENDRQRFEGRIAGWRRWAPNLMLWHGPGNHMTVLKQPHVGALANWLRTQLISLRSDDRE